MIITTLCELALRPNSCPRAIKKRLGITESKQLNKYIEAHKMVPLLPHLYSCNKCKKKFSKKQLRDMETNYLEKLYLSSIREKEIPYLDQLFKKNNLKGILFKELTNLSVYRDFQVNKIACDIDVLISRDDYRRINKILQKNNWLIKAESEYFNRSKNYQWRELCYYRSDSKSVFLELHFNIAQIRLEYKDANKLEKLTRHCIRNIKDCGLKVSNNPTLLLLNIIHFYYHDRCFGIRKAIEIKVLANSLTKKEWLKVMRLINKFELERSFWVTLLLIEKMFLVKIIPDGINIKLPTKFIVLIRLFPMKKNQIIKDEMTKYMKLKTHLFFRLLS